MARGPELSGVHGFDDSVPPRKKETPGGRGAHCESDWEFFLGGEGAGGARGGAKERHVSVRSETRYM